MIYDDLAEEYNIGSFIDEGMTKGNHEFKGTFNIIHDIYAIYGVSGLGNLTLPDFRECVLEIEDYYHNVRQEDVAFNYLNMWPYYCKVLNKIQHGHFRKELDLGTI